MASPSGPPQPPSPVPPAPFAPPVLRLQDVSLRFAQGTQALAGVSLQVEAGGCVALLGPSGCGKSTVLRLLAGLLAPTEGRVQAPAVDACEGAAQTAFVFQEPTLMPWATVADNVWLPLRLQGQTRAQASERVQAMLSAVGLADFAQARPAQLSGGMKMRASIARALVTEPRVLLMDEPFAALDDFTRQRLQSELLQWRARLQPATVCVTHNVAEAVFLAQRVLVMAPSPGRVVAEIAVDMPYPRDPAWRREPAFFERCAQVAQAMEAALA
ncbi:MAG: ABC transporter ATP-binding protein [Rubrivivax sp.]|jgi:NitT/TauT family transport system ATP-binding protein|nr:ABC transporter ATP-binding protein [Rubrivivax sp.]